MRTMRQSRPRSGENHGGKVNRVVGGSNPSVPANISEGSSVQLRALRLGRRGRGSEARPSEIQVLYVIILNWDVV